MGDFVMPSLGADMEAGTLLEWRVAPGDAVHRGDIVAVVDTEKATIEVEVFEDGVVEALLVEPGTEAPVGAPLARIAAAPAGEAPAEDAPAAGGAAAPPRKRAARPRKPAAKPREPAAKPRKPAARPRRAAAGSRAPAATAPRPATGAGRVRASPLARRRAAERGIDLPAVAGSGPGGAVVAADLEREPAAGSQAAAPVAPAAPPAARGDRQAAMRHAIATLMARSAREIPHYHLATTIDMAAAVRWLADANERRPVGERLLPGALLLKATALAAREVPALNGFWDGGFVPAPAVHLGVAVSLRGGGLVAPAIHDADRLTLDELMAALRDLVGRARAGRLRSSEMSDPTLTVTNLGDQGVDEVHGVIYAPQVALVGFGRVAERPWASGGMLGVRPTVRATLAADHRASDGVVGARLLNAIDRLLQHPEDL
ncbi:MAG TPA: dihydrolipoamide acetyltransferase family protein [Acidimicrobiales bacterium]